MEALMKNIWRIIPVLLLSVAMAGCSDDDDTYLPPNQAIISALNQLYPGVKNIEWEQYL